MVTFASQQSQEQQQQDQTVFNTQRVFIQQIVTDSELVDKSQHLESTLQTGNLLEYCNYKIETAEEGSAESNIWKFILASFDNNKYEKFISLLGFDNENLNSKLELLETITPNGSNEQFDKQFSESLHLNNGSSSLFDQIKQNQETNDEIQSIDLNFDNGNYFNN